MIKKYFFTIIICLLAFIIKAQPVITYNGNAPKTGDVYNVSGAFGTFDPGPAGGGQSWDFSDVQPTISASSAVVDAASTPFANDFPEATIAYVNNPSDNTYSYHRVTNTELLYVGVGMDPGTSTQNINHFPDARKEMQYPFSYNDVYTDSYLFVFPSALMLIHNRGTITATADAWGSVKTPAGSYNNTLRVKIEKAYTDSVWNTAGVFMSATPQTETEYQWYTADSHYPVLDIMITEAGSSISYISLANGIENNQLISKISLYPNPATDIISIKLPNNLPDKMELAIINLKGQQLLQIEKTGENRLSADISKLLPGVYFLEIKNSKGNYERKKFIKR